MASVAPAPHRFSVEEYHRMAGAGLFGDDDRVELVEGEIIDMAPIGSRHAACVDRLNRLLVSRLGERAIVRVQSPVRLSDLSEPQPDVAVLAPRRDFYAGAHPGPADVLVVVEVADTTVAWDRGVKVPLYARAGVAEVWLVDLAGETVEVSRQPGAGGYGESHRAGRGDRLEVMGAGIGVDEILG
jgi:Uma2 family endonuclease